MNDRIRDAESLPWPNNAPFRACWIQCSPPINSSGNNQKTTRPANAGLVLYGIGLIASVPFYSYLMESG